MPRARYYRTTFFPPMYGQHKVWHKGVNPILSKSDDIVGFGNFLTISMDNVVTPNNKMLNVLLLRWSTEEVWAQLIGPNEIFILNNPGLYTSDRVDEVLRAVWLKTTNSWASKVPHQGLLVAAVNKGRLVTHGGLTHGLWEDIGRPDTAEQAAVTLNRMFAASLYQGKSVALGNSPNFYADPIFADPIREVYPSWLTSRDTMPFTQIHGAPGFNTVEGRNMLSDSLFYGHGENVSFTYWGSDVFLPGGSHFINVHSNFSHDEVMEKPPEPWDCYVERLPVVDSNDDTWKDPQVQKVMSQYYSP